MVNMCLLLFDTTTNGYTTANGYTNSIQKDNGIVNGGTPTQKRHPPFWILVCDQDLSPDSSLYQAKFGAVACQRFTESVYSTTWHLPGAPVREVYPSYVRYYILYTNIGLYILPSS